MIKDLSGKSRTAFLYFIETSVLVISILIIFSSYKTFGNISPPIKLNEPAVVTTVELKNIHNESVGYEVNISRNITYYEDATVLVSTQLINKDNNYTLDLRDTKITPDVLGTFKTNKLFFVSHILKGNWCMVSTTYWTPSFSLREHSLKTKESCFKVE